MSDSGHVGEHAAASQTATGSHGAATAELHPPSTAAAIPELPFTERQIEQFDDDDGDAGRAIGKMLALFFFYTVIAMSIVAWWTFGRTSAREAAQSAAKHGESAKVEPAAQEAE
jgi:hypothetical protein